MNDPSPAQGPAIRTIIMTHHNTRLRAIGFYLIMTPRPIAQLGVDARISSRITTGIRVVEEYQINYNWFNELYAVSQYKVVYT